MTKIYDSSKIFAASDETMMCEKHPGEEWPNCTKEDDCPGPGMPWKDPYLIYPEE